MAVMWRSFLVLALVVACAGADKVEKAGTVRSEQTWSIFGGSDGKQQPAATPQEPTGMVSAPNPPEMDDAIKVLKEDMWALLTAKNYQWAIATFFLVFGAIALYDGVQFFKVLLIVAVVAVFSCLVLSQLEASWVSPSARFAKYVASLEFGLFMGLVAYQGWKGTQLLLGLTLGMYLFQTVQALVPLATMFPQAEVYAKSSVAIVGVYTLMVAVGACLVHEKWGAGRLLGIVAPLLGSSFFVASIGYFVQLAFTDPALAKDAHVTVKPEQVTSVFQFWYMIVYPLHSQDVGIFSTAGEFLIVGDYKMSFDRILGIFFEVVFFILGMRFQLKGRKNKQLVKAIDQFCDTSESLQALSRQLSSSESSSLNRGLLSNAGSDKV